MTILRVTHTNGDVTDYPVPWDAVPDDYVQCSDPHSLSGLTTRTSDHWWLPRTVWFRPTPYSMWQRVAKVVAMDGTRPINQPKEKTMNVITLEVTELDGRTWTHSLYANRLDDFYDTGHKSGYPLAARQSECEPFRLVSRVTVNYDGRTKYSESLKNKEGCNPMYYTKDIDGQTVQLAPGTVEDSVDVSIAGRSFPKSTVKIDNYHHAFQSNLARSIDHIVKAAKSEPCGEEHPRDAMLRKFADDFGFQAVWPGKPDDCYYRIVSEGIRGEICPTLERAWTHWRQAVQDVHREQLGTDPITIGVIMTLRKRLGARVFKAASSSGLAEVTDRSPSKGIRCVNNYVYHYEEVQYE